MIDVLKLIYEEMRINLGLNYEFGRMSKSPPPYPYWVGEYTEAEPVTEDGKETATFILTGFVRGKYIDLEKQKLLIKSHFKHGVTKVTDNGAAVAVFYAGGYNIPTEDIDLKKCQINLSIKQWKGC